MSPSTLTSAVTQAASGRPPVGRFHEEKPSPEEWLLGLWKTAEGTTDEGDVRYALGMVMRTGDSRHLARLGPLAELGTVFDGEDVLDALRRPHLYRKPETAKAYGRGLARAILAGGMEYTPELRVLAEEDRMKGALLGALMVHDPEWAARNLSHVTSADGPEAIDMVRDAQQLVDAVAPEVSLDSFFRQLAVDEHALAKEVWLALDASDVVESESEPEPEEAKARRIAWRGADGRWFLVPEGLTFMEGDFEIRRGLDVVEVDPAAVEEFVVPEEEARRKMAEQLQDMVSNGLQALRKAIDDPTVDPATPEEITAQLAGVAQRFAGSEQVQNFIGRFGAALEKAAEKGVEAIPALRQAVQAPSSADREATRAPFQLRLGRGESGAAVELRPRHDVPMPGHWQRLLGGSDDPATWLPLFQRALAHGFPGDPSELTVEVWKGGLRFQGSKAHHVGWLYASLAKMMADPDLLANPRSRES